jgi:kynurenine formamidase
VCGRACVACVVEDGGCGCMLPTQETHTHTGTHADTHAHTRGPRPTSMLERVSVAS